jgi:hypothetical protein
MELSLLAARQKRAKDWSEALENALLDQALRDRTRQRLSDYKGLLLKCWEEQAVSADAAQKLADLERELESLNELARVTVVPKRGASQQSK